MALSVECDNLYPQNKFCKCSSGYCVWWRIKLYVISGVSCWCYIFNVGLPKTAYVGHTVFVF